MDVILQILDTLILDRAYAAALPASSPPVTFANGTLSRPIPPTIQPASKYLYLEPSEYAWMSQWNRDNINRQALSLFFITWTFGGIVYFMFATLSYYLVFDHNTMKHPRFLKNQIRKEISQSVWSMPFMSVPTSLMFLLEVRGYGKFYDTPSEAPFPLYNILQFPLFLLFTDFWIYLIHRGLHHPLIYKNFHKPHHKWIVPTPFASHAFHPLDGFAQSFPYHVFAFIFPLQKLAYVGLFVFVNFWTISIHDGEHLANNTVINGAACHSIHHERFNYNYGQYTTVWDRVWGTYNQPSQEMFDPAAKKGAAAAKLLEKQLAEIDKHQVEAEGKDEREYENDTVEVKKNK